MKNDKNRFAETEGQNALLKILLPHFWYAGLT
jgi:hypothetical protein